jgi:hypothetical protein
MVWRTCVYFIGNILQSLSSVWLNTSQNFTISTSISFPRLTALSIIFTGSARCVSLQKLWNTWPQPHKTFEYSQENSQLKYLSPRMGKLKILQVFTYLSLRMLSMSRIFSTQPFSDSDTGFENSLENTQKFYDGGAWLTHFKNICNLSLWIITTRRHRYDHLSQGWHLFTFCIYLVKWHLLTDMSYFTKWHRRYLPETLFSATVISKTFRVHFITDRKEKIIGFKTMNIIHSHFDDTLMARYCRWPPIYFMSRIVKYCLLCIARSMRKLLWT